MRRKYKREKQSSDGFETIQQQEKEALLEAELVEGEPLGIF